MAAREMKHSTSMNGFSYSGWDAELAAACNGLQVHDTIMSRSYREATECDLVAEDAAVPASRYHNHDHDHEENSPTIAPDSDCYAKNTSGFSTSRSGFGLPSTTSSHNLVGFTLQTGRSSPPAQQESGCSDGRKGSKGPGINRSQSLHANCSQTLATETQDSYKSEKQKEKKFAGFLRLKLGGGNASKRTKQLTRSDSDSLKPKVLNGGYFNGAKMKVKTLELREEESDEVTVESSETGFKQLGEINSRLAHSSGHLAAKSAAANGELETEESLEQLPDGVSSTSSHRKTGKQQQQQQQPLFRKLFSINLNKQLFRSHSAIMDRSGLAKYKLRSRKNGHAVANAASNDGQMSMSMHDDRSVIEEERSANDSYSSGISFYRPKSYNHRGDSANLPPNVAASDENLAKTRIAKRTSLPSAVSADSIQQQYASIVSDSSLNRRDRRSSLSEMGFGKWSSYTKLEKLGEGTYATVYRGKSHLTESFVALKEIRLEYEEGAPCTAIREVSLLRQLKHANIVTLHDIIHTPKSLTLVFEYVDHDLKQYMDDCGGLMHLYNIKLFMFQLLRGLAYCHGKKILHRDLKPQNLLISEKGELKLADFGLARAKSIPTKTYSNEVVTLWYRAPDILLGSTDYSTHIDVWGCGCILFEMVSGRPLFPGSSVDDQLHLIFKTLGRPTNETWPGIESSATFADYAFPPYKAQSILSLAPRFEFESLSLFYQLVDYNVAKRVSARDAMQHSFFYALGEDLLDLPDGVSIFSVPGIELRRDPGTFAQAEAAAVNGSRRPSNSNEADKDKRRRQSLFI